MSTTADSGGSFATKMLVKLGSALLAVLSLALVSGCGDGPGFTLAVVNGSARDIRVRVSGLHVLGREGSPEDMTFVIGPQDARALPFVSLDFPEVGTPQGAIWIYGQDCDLIATFDSNPGTLRLEVDRNGAELSEGDPQDEGLPLAEVSQTGCSQ
jgi:hypothetical protein